MCTRRAVLPSVEQNFSDGHINVQVTSIRVMCCHAATLFEYLFNSGFMEGASLFGKQLCRILFLLFLNFQNGR